MYYIVIYVLPVGSGKKRFSKCLIFRKTAFFFEQCVSVNQQSQYTIRNLISKLAPNWLTNVKVIDLTFFFLGQTIGLLQTGP